MNFENIMLSEKARHILYDSIHVKRSEQANP